ncbi:MAG TPA: hypothetical protein VFF68_10155 [Anaerolineaceae bacterium]|nr:hypothetical protein [Anaerolineaceae bacterium]
MSALTAALWISLISIVLLFAAMAVMWGMMALLARIPDGSKAEEAEVSVSAPGEDVPTLADTPVLPLATNKQRAAALAVTIALALRDRSQRLALKDADDSVSAWQSVRRATRVSQRNQMYARK